ncbi:DUF1801 domain-containing protein [Salinibacterium sp. NSLL150]|uniref:DUF1801 domain-containing protein n=1 Tax=unclassified Salinibacterium TaxID=2632331 RepID=UPI0018CFD395|nr:MULTISPECIES: DUF1801 domain-containing protein [unclassified Salinibacterium]MBH0098745.1 DUF1801 domain-containing protein [Salinibacterium sp. NSLL35]MBH0101500.1 DUF1801 domain-containing protein [Salinibacterium sp. NSLL150]MBH0104259.1 DUF1801 domain-containing protein [Salinibacterium sp. NSLL16]MBH0107020.1 DUF1801 domain-containing protein [Salinibacterium sp. NSLL17]
MNTPNKTAPTTVTVAEFIDSVPTERRRDEAQTLLDIFGRSSGQPAVMWGTSIIGFGSSHYRYATGREGDTATIGFSPRKAKISLYTARNFREFPELLERLGTHELAVGCLYVKKLADVDLAVLEELLTRSYEVARFDYDALAEDD